MANFPPKGVLPRKKTFPIHGSVNLEVSRIKRILATEPTNVLLGTKDIAFMHMYGYGL